MRQDDFKNRYLIKVSSSVLIAVFNMIIQLMLPRIFSVGEYGFYTYNLNVFTSVVTIANLSASNAFVSKFSKRNAEVGLVYFYLKFFSLAALILSIVVVALFPVSFFQSAFAGQTLLVVLLGIEAAITNKLLTDCVSMYDASAISRFPAVVQIILKAIISVSVMVGYLYGKYNLAVFYFVQIMATLFASTVLVYAIVKDQKRRYKKRIVLPYNEYMREFISFCRPLIVANVVAQLVVIIMNWALMKWSGEVEQAMFGVAWQLNSLVGYVFSPYAELSKREFAVIYDDREKLKSRFIQSLKLMMWLTSYFAIFIMVMSDWILPILFGDKYSGATMVTAIIMLYTIYQAWGQVAGSYMLALEKTKANAVISILGQCLMVVFIFLFQMPNHIWSNSLGALGIALNYLLVNLIMTFISVCYISHDLQCSALYNLMIQIVPLVFLTIVALLIRLIVENCVNCMGIWENIIRILVSGIIYTALTLGIVCIRPSLIGVNKVPIKSISNIHNKNL